MATPNQVPRNDGEGNLGTSLKNWLKLWVKSIFVSGNLTDGTYNASVADTADAITKKHTQNSDTILNEGGDNEVTAAELRNLVDSPPGSGDMEKSTYDTNDNDIVDKAESVDDGAGNSKTASEVKTHIDSTDNPHNVEADQVTTDSSGETVQDKIDDVDSHIANTDNPHEVNKADVGLTNVPDLDTTNAVNNEHTHSNKTELDKVSDGDHDVRTDNPHSVDKNDISLGNVDNVQQIPSSYLDTDGTFAANSDLKVPSQKASKTYVDNLLSANDAMVFKGVIDCSGNPNYPAADAGDTYRISVVGKLGGASGINVEVGDIAICISDSTSSGDQATVGEFWDIIQVNIDGAVVATSPFISVDDNIPKYNGATGRIIEDSGVAISTVTGHINSTDNPHSVEADQVATDSSGETVQDVLDSVETDITNLKKSSVSFVIDGGGSEISTGIHGDLLVPFAGTITKVTLLADQDGDIVIDIWKDTYTNFNPTDVDSICDGSGVTKPTISSDKKSQDPDLTGWTTSISEDDILRFNVDSVSTIERVTIILEITRT